MALDSKYPVVSHLLSVIQYESASELPFCTCYVIFWQISIHEGQPILVFHTDSHLINPSVNKLSREEFIIQVQTHRTRVLCLNKKAQNCSP